MVGACGSPLRSAAASSGAATVEGGAGAIARYDDVHSVPLDLEEGRGRGRDLPVEVHRKLGVRHETEAASRHVVDAVVPREGSGPALSTNRSRAIQPGSAGSCRITFWNRRYAAGARLIAVPG